MSSEHPTPAPTLADVTPTYEQARDELDDIVRRLEAGGTSLEDSLALWERGEELARVATAWLDGARARLDAARNSVAGADVEVPPRGDAPQV